MIIARLFQYLAVACCCFCVETSAAQPTAKDLPKVVEPVIKDNEIETIDFLITATEKSLDEQKQLRALILEYQELETRYIGSPEDRELLYKVIKSAKRTLEMIKATHLTYNFDSAFIDELTLFAQVGSKKAASK